MDDAEPTTLPATHRGFGPSRRFDTGHRFAELPGVPLLFGCRVHPSCGLYKLMAADDDGERYTTHDQEAEAEE